VDDHRPGSAVDAEELDERRLQVIAAQVSGVRWQVALTIVVIAAVAWPAAPPALVAGWAALVLASRELRSRALLRLAADKTTPIATRLRHTVAWNAVAGIGYGASGLFMVWLDTTGDAVLTMILVSLAAGGVSVSATVIRAYVAYAAPMFVPVALMWALAGPWLGFAVATLVLLFFGVQMRFARDNLATFEQSFRIRQENQALVQRLAAERSELERTRDAAVQANLEKSRFLAAASHDLRQPLQALTLNSGHLARLPLVDDARAIAADIGSSVEQLRTMLDALLDLSKLDAGVVVAAPRRVRLQPQMQAVVAGFRAAVLARGLALECECPADLAVLTDPELLRRMLANLVDNAVKFTASGRVVVSAEPVGDQVEIAVSDSGPGIAAEHQRLIFEDLVQLPVAGIERPSGHGLGLGIVRRAATLLGTEVQLDSAPGRGASFRWRVPRVVASEAPAPADEVVPALHGLVVLVLDDDAMVRGAYAAALGRAGATTLTAATAAEALRQIDRSDAAVVDWRLGEPGDGFQAVERMRALRPGFAAVMVTADTGRSIAEAAARHGVALLRKPVDMATLARALLEAMARERAGPGRDQGPSSAEVASAASTR